MIYVYKLDFICMYIYIIYIYIYIYIYIFFFIDRLPSVHNGHLSTSVTYLHLSYTEFSMKNSHIIIRLTN